MTNEYEPRGIVCNTLGRHQCGWRAGHTHLKGAINNER
jgi:hypothetical protein